MVVLSFLSGLREKVYDIKDLGVIENDYFFNNNAEYFLKDTSFLDWGNKTVLDIGCDGKGTKRGILKNYPFVKYIGIDCQESLATDIVTDAKNLPFKSNSLDMVLSLGLGLQSLQGVKEVLKDNGHFILSYSTSSLKDKPDSYIKDFEQNFNLVDVLKYKFQLGYGYYLDSTTFQTFLIGQKK